MVPEVTVRTAKAYLTLEREMIAVINSVTVCFCVQTKVGADPSKRARRGKSVGLVRPPCHANGIL